jgi:hypothetical protein
MKSIAGLASITFIAILHAAPSLALSQPVSNSTSSQSKSIWLNDRHNPRSSEIVVGDKVLISDLSQQEERQRTRKEREQKQIEQIEQRETCQPTKRTQEQREQEKIRASLLQEATMKREREAQIPSF